jgi:pyruvate formate lyase activating enzyme
VTGASNRRILENAEHLAGCDVPLLIRTPVIPTVNDTPAAISAIAEFIHNFPNLLYYELMPFHRLAEGKYRSLGLCYQAADLEPPSKETMQALADCARSKGVANVKVG